MTTPAPVTRRSRITAALRRGARSGWVRLVVTAAVLTVVVLLVDPVALVDRVRRADGPLFGAAVAALLGALVLGGFRWFVLLRATGVQTTAHRWTRAYAVGTFANSFLPAGFGGDAVRAVMASARREDLVPTATSILVDRLTGIGSLVVIAWIGVALDPGGVPGSLVAALAWLTAAGVAVVVGGVLAARAGGRVAHLLPARLRSPLARARDALAASGKAGAGPLSAAGLLGLAYQALVVLETWLLARSIGLDLPMALMGVAVTLVIVLTLIPFSIAGLGIREGGYVAVLATVDVSATDAVLLSLLTLAAFAVASAPGALGMLWWPGRATEATPALKAKRPDV